MKIRQYILKIVCGSLMTLLLSWVTTSPAFAAAGINSQINFQGKLVDNNGLNVADNTYTVVFSLYNVSSGGAATWTETDSVTTSNGIFQVALGAVTSLPGSVDFNTDTWYLGIKVGSDAEMTPRVRLAAVPYAFNASEVNGLSVTNNGGNTLSIAANKTFTVNNTISFSGTDSTAMTLPSSSTTLAGLSIAQTFSAAQTIQSNSASALTVGANGATNPGLQVDASTASSATGVSIKSAAAGSGVAISGISSGTNENLTLDAKGSGTVTIGGTSTGNIILGGSTNGLTFSTSSGPSYAGTGRPTRTITLSPEYAGAVLTAFYGAGTDTNITGNMTSDTDTTEGTTIRNYYNWIATSGTQQFYTVAVRITLPSDFSAWNTSNALTVSYITQNATAANSSVDVRLYNENSASVVASSTGNASVSWTTASFGSSSLTGWATAGQNAVIYLRLGSTSSNYARVGDIKLTYLAAY